MPAFINLLDQRFGRLLVLEFAGQTQTKRGTFRGSFWKCKCDCGNIVVIRSNSLRVGHTKSCGCLNLENIANNWKQKLADPNYKSKTNERRKLYKIDYPRLIQEQSGLCAICGKPEVSKRSNQYLGANNISMGKLVFDHDHETNKMRELLCSYCNLMLGNAKDSIRTLENAIKYLKKHGK